MFPKGIAAALMLVWPLFAGCVSNQSKGLKVIEYPDKNSHTFYSVDELQQQYADRLLRINAQCSDQFGNPRLGFGVILGINKKNNFIVSTPTHVINNCEDNLRITHCEKDNGSYAVKSIKKHDFLDDISILTLASTATHRVDQPFLTRPQAEQNVFYLGYDQSCEKNSLGTIDTINTATGLITARGYSTPTGSSGGLVFSEYGAVGMLNRSGGGGQKISFSTDLLTIIGGIEAASTPVTGTVEANNIPPLSKTGTKQKIIEDFNKYLYFAQQMSDFINEDLVDANSMNQIIPPYGHHFEILTLSKEHYFIGIRQYYTDFETSFLELYENFENLHAQIRGINEDLQKIYKGTQTVIPAIKKQNINKRLAVFSTTFDNFKITLNKES